MSSRSSIDLSVKGCTVVLTADKGYVFAPSLNGFSQLDTEYTLVLNEGETDELSYSVSGGGLVLVPETGSIVWTLDTRPLEAKIHKGYIKSDSVVAGIALYLDIVVHVKE